METFGDILDAALAKRSKPMIEVVLHAPKGIINHRNPGWGSVPSTALIPNIKALRDATKIPGDTSAVMGLTEAKAIIERIRDKGTATIRMSAERYGFFMVNRHDLTNYTWQVKSSRFYYPKPVEEVFTI